LFAGNENNIETGTLDEIQNISQKLLHTVFRNINNWAVSSTENTVLVVVSEVGANVYNEIMLSSKI
jgi:hypothetical protein